MNYCYRNSTEVYFTDALVEDVKQYLIDLSVKRVFVISGSIFSKSIADFLISGLKNNFEVCSFYGVSTNPTESMVNFAFLDASMFSPEVIITVGGGSVHDCGKAVSILLCNEESSRIDDFTVTGKLSVPGIKATVPIITIPTLLGSGAEVSPAALLRIENIKKVVFSPLLHPKATFVDANLCAKSPSQIIRRSAFDSFIQALEGFISTSANEFSNAFALGAIREFASCLDSLFSCSFNKKTLEKIATASIFSSYVCSVASVGAIHALSDPLSGRYNIHHADALAMVAPHVLRYNLSATSANLNELFSILNLDCTDSNNPENADALVNYICNIIEKLELGDFSHCIDSLAIQEMVPECFNGDMFGNPYRFSSEEIRKVLQDALIRK